MGRLSLLLAAAALVAGCGDNLAAWPCADDWPQWGGGPGHLGASCARGQKLERSFAEIVYDPFTDQEEADAFGELVIHYQSPLIRGDEVFVMGKSGTYTPCPIDPDTSAPNCNLADLYRLNSQIWTEQALTWNGDQLEPRWTFESDWKPEPQAGFEPMFQAVIVGDRIAVPGAGGTVFELDRDSGAVVRRDQPFATIDPDTYVAGGLAAAPDGSIVYTTLTLDHAMPYATDARGALVVVAPDGGIRTVDFSSMIPDAPTPLDLCETTDDPMMTPRPWPPLDPDNRPLDPPMIACGTQRPGINATPAIGPDGRIFVVSRAHFDSRYSYVVALNPDLTTAWTRSLRGLLADGCGVLTAADGDTMDHRFDCTPGAPTGVDLATGRPPAARVDDSSSSSPVALPDGGVVYGAYTGYNGARGHTFHFDRDGAPAGVFDFGWDTTPAVVGFGDGYRIYLKDNHYGVDANGVDLGPYFMTRLDEHLGVDWKYQSAQTESCIRGPDGSMQCSEDHPNGFEWCINAPAIDADGTMYGNSEDGWLYAIDHDGNQRDRFFLDRSLGAAYTPVALDALGRVYAMNNGRLIVVGSK